MALVAKAYGISVIGIAVGYNCKVAFELLTSVVSQPRQSHYFGVLKFIHLYDRNLGTHMNRLSEYMCTTG